MRFPSVCAVTSCVALLMACTPDSEKRDDGGSGGAAAGGAMGGAVAGAGGQSGGAMAGGAMAGGEMAGGAMAGGAMGGGEMAGGAMAGGEMAGGAMAGGAMAGGAMGGGAMAGGSMVDPPLGGDPGMGGAAMGGEPGGPQENPFIECEDHEACPEGHFCATECFEGPCGADADVPAGTRGAFCQPCVECEQGLDAIGGECPMGCGAGVPPEGPGCNLDMTPRERLAAVCRWYADCALDLCAFEGEVCRDAVFGSCNAIPAAAAEQVVPAVCGHDACAETIGFLSALDEGLAVACMPDAPVELCGGDEPPEAALTCVPLSACLSGCEGNAACSADCQMRATPEAVAILTDYAMCAQDAGCMDGECAGMACPEALLACRENSAGVAPCDATLECLGGCEGGDEDCNRACFASGTVGAQDLMAAHVECVQRANCRSLVECPACEGTLDACDADGGPAPAGDLSCMEFAGCAQDCENDPACIEDCTARARPGSPELLQAVGACAARSRCEDNECLERECADPWNACRQDSSGDALCGDVLVCITVCGQDEACARTCMHEGTVAAQDGVQAVFQCASNAGCRSLEGCPQCEREINACDQGAPVPPVDPVGCPELNQCISACEGDLACRRACEDAADDEDVVLFEAILVCAEESGCMDDECVAEQCAEPILACREDSAGEVLCADVWGCMLECVPDGGDPCLQACFQSGTIEAQDLVVDHLDCIGVEMCRDPLDCPQCEATEAACIDHGVVP